MKNFIKYCLALLISSGCVFSTNGIAQKSLTKEQKAQAAIQMLECGATGKSWSTCCQNIFNYSEAKCQEIQAKHQSQN